MSLLDCLLENQIDFVLIGGMAAVAHGSSQLTRDLDICIPLGAESLLRLQSALEPFHPRVRAGKDRIPLQLDEPAAGRLKNLYVLTDEGNLDCLGIVAGIGDFDMTLKESVEIQLNGRACHVLGLDALIRAKEVMGRPRDLLTALELRAIREKTGESGPD